jgi:hypothetical protein
MPYSAPSKKIIFCLDLASRFYTVVLSKGHSDLKIIYVHWKKWNINL